MSDFGMSEMQTMQKVFAIFLRIVAKSVKVPFYVQHFKSESLE